MQKFRDAIESHDLNALLALFAEGVVFRSPVVHTPYQGRAQLKPLFRAVGQVVEDLRYTRQLGARSAADHALVFRARVDDREIEGCDFIHLNEDGLIDEMYVMIRPLSGLIGMAQAMRNHLDLDETGEQDEVQAVVSPTPAQ
jgi:SnoaL-like domain